MKSFSRLLLLVAVLGLGALMAVPAPAAGKLTAEQIGKLIEKMGSGNFDEREKASQDLEALGDEALEALRKAAKSEDAEVRKRAEELVAKMEKRSESGKILAATKVRLVYKDTPVTDAIKDFAKKSGYTITLHDPQNKLKERKLSLDTGEVTFWQAMDLFCSQAGLVEADETNLNQLLPNPNVNPRPPIRIRPVPLQPGVQPGANPAPPAQPRLPGAGGLLQVGVPATKPAQGGQPGQPGQPGLPGQPAIGFGGALGAPAAGFVRVGFGGGMPALNNQITLLDGKPQTVPTDSSSAIRVKVSDHLKNLGAAPEGEIRLGLRLSPEPRMQLVQIMNVRVEKALDDQGQKLNQVLNAGPNPQGGFGIGGAVIPPGAVPRALPAVAPALPGGAAFAGNVGWAFGGMGNLTMIQLKKGEKAAKTIKELTGVANAVLLVSGKPAITVEGILQAAGKSFKSDDAGTLKISTVTRNANGSVTVTYEMEQPGNAPGAFFPGAIPGGIQIQILPAPVVPPQAVPPQKVPQPLPPQRQGQAPQQQQGQAQAVPVGLQVAQAGRAQAAVQIQIGGAAVPILRGGPANLIGNPFSMVDEKGNQLTLTNSSQRLVRKANALVVENVLTFQVTKEQVPAKLMYAPQKSVTVDVPFSLKDITIP